MSYILGQIFLPLNNKEKLCAGSKLASKTLTVPPPSRLSLCGAHFFYHQYGVHTFQESKSESVICKRSLCPQNSGFIYPNIYHPLTRLKANRNMCKAKDRVSTEGIHIHHTE